MSIVVIATATTKFAKNSQGTGGRNTASGTMARPTGDPLTPGRMVRHADPEQGEDRDHVGDGVDAHRARRADRLHEDATKARPGKQGDGEARVQLVVPLHDVRLADEGGQVGE